MNHWPVPILKECSETAGFLVHRVRVRWLLRPKCTFQFRSSLGSGELFAAFVFAASIACDTGLFHQLGCYHLFFSLGQSASFECLSVL